MLSLRIADVPPTATDHVTRLGSIHVPWRRESVAGWWVALRGAFPPESLGNEFDGNLTKKNLRIDNPYNTYRYRGLPPGPISIVSYDSLEAALNPLLTDYLYFVSMGNGFHKFSKTLTEHNEAVLKYQINDR